MKPNSPDLRQRILHAVDQGTARTQIVALFQISLSTLKRSIRQRRETGALTIKPIPGRLSKKGAVLDAELSPQLAAHDDATLEQHCQLWAESHGVHVSTSSLSRSSVRLGWTRKKRHWVPPSGANPLVRPGAIWPSISPPTA
jgi:transposase